MDTLTPTAPTPRTPAPGDGALVSLSLVKQYLKIEHDLEDELLSTLIIPAAEDYCLWYVRRSVAECVLLPAVKQAVCLSCGDLYLNREAASLSRYPYQGNPTVDALLWAHRDLCDGATWGALEGEWCPDYGLRPVINPLLR
jgi:uncharacterized phage protein (predicted DNA packaging)